MSDNKLFRLDRGFTLIELVIIIVVLGILAAVAVPKFVDFAESAKVNTTKEELNMLKKAIVGNPSTITGGEYIDRGFEGDCGFVPSSLLDLVAKPGSLSVYDPISRLGWNGPYMDSSGGDYLTDSWGAIYIYQPSSRRIVSSGGTGDSIFVSF